jgi:hypothetical protein
MEKGAMMGTMQRSLLVCCDLVLSVAVSDAGSRWVALTDPREGSRGGLYFRHADGNQWYLPKPTGNKTKGWTTWNGQRYSLSCWK